MAKVDLGKFSVKELANTGVDFRLVDEQGMLVEPGEEIPITFRVYGADSSRIAKARREYNQVLEAKNARADKVEKAALKFIGACVKTWDDFDFNGNEVKNGDTDALIEFLDECPMFRDQIIEFVFDRDNFLAK